MPRIARLAIVVLAFLCVPSARATTYHLSPTGNDGNSGTSGSPWLTPNHSVNCGDILLAATGTYPSFYFDWGTVSSCGSGSSASVAWVICATFDGCKISSSTQHAVAINSSNWGIQGFEATTTSSATATCFMAVPPNSSTSIHHIIFANDIANGCQNGGFSAIYNGSAATDYIVYVGNIAWNAAQQGPGCASGFNVVNPTASDTNSGTHVFEGGNFSFSNVDGSTCGGSVATDGEGFILDSIFTNGYTQQMYVANNIAVGNGGRCIEVYKNNSGAGAPIYIKNNTCWDNDTQLSQTPGGSLGEIFLYQSSNSLFTANIAMTNQANGPQGYAYYAYLLNTPTSTDTVAGNDGYSAAGNNYLAQYGSGFSFGSNLTTNPVFSNATVPGSPSCGSATSVPNCMATVISNFAPTASGLSTYGYQTSPSTTDSLFPAWLCNVSLPVSNFPTNCGTGAATYYISYGSGSNSNAGTKVSPWKSHPFMQTVSGCAGSAPTYSHSAGDTFIFKQGDSWPNACFDMAISVGGSSGNPDTYTFDPTWGTAGGTTGNKGQAVGTYKFTAGGSAISGADGFNRFIVVTASNVTINGAELTGMTWTGCPSYGNAQGIYEGGTQNVIVSNLYAHGWTHSGATCDALSWVVGFAGSPYNAGSQVTGSVFDGTGATDSGEAVYLIPNLDNNIARNMTNGLLPNANAVVHDNTVGPINQSFDASDHENCFEPLGLFPGVTSTNYFYNNIFHDCYAVGILTQGGAASSGIEIDYLWDNVAWTGAQSTIPFNFDSVSTSNSSSAVYAWNNTIYGGSLVCMRSTNRGNGNYGTLDVRNNHCISDSGLSSFAVGGNTQTINNNTLMSTATAASQGYTATQTYAYSPTSSSSGTVAQGVNLSSLGTGAKATLLNDTTYGGIRTAKARPTSGAWDSGAYQNSSSPPPAAPSNLKVISIQ